MHRSDGDRHQSAPASARPTVAQTERPGLDRLDVLGAWSLGATAFGEGHFLAFMQVVEADALNVRRMKEEILFGSGLDESETLVRQFLNAAFGHCCATREILLGD